MERIDFEWTPNPFSLTACTIVDWEKLRSAQERFDNNEITLIELKEITEGKRK
jgi:hypothetical protein